MYRFYSVQILVEHSLRFVFKRVCFHLEFSKVELELSKVKFNFKLHNGRRCLGEKNVSNVL